MPFLWSRAQACQIHKQHFFPSASRPNPSFRNPLFVSFVFAALFKIRMFLFVRTHGLCVYARARCSGPKGCGCVWLTVCIYMICFVYFPKFPLIGHIHFDGIAHAQINSQAIKQVLIHSDSYDLGRANAVASGSQRRTATWQTIDPRCLLGARGPIDCLGGVLRVWIGLNGWMCVSGVFADDKQMIDVANSHSHTQTPLPRRPSQAEENGAK